jgi:two-component system nitrogen regulation response regulator GlnG
VRKVLIVDDEPSVRFVLARTCERVGAPWEEAGSAEEARDVLGRGRNGIGLVLLDIRLPDMDGFAVVRELAKEAGAPTVVLVSTRDASDYGRRVSDSGVAGFISKSRLSGDTLRAILGEP